MSRILITGAAGFIGSHLAKALEEQGHELILLDNFSRGKQSYLNKLGVKTKCHNVDLKDKGVSWLWFTRNIDMVYHTACRIGGMQFLHGSAAKELQALQDNLAIDKTVFKECVKNDIKRIVYTSSISIYNTSKQSGTEAVFHEYDLFLDRLEPEGGYGWSKFIAEWQLDKLTEMGFKVGIARIFKSYGPYDDYSPESGQVVLSLMRKILTRKQPLVVWGSGRATRNLVYIDDLIDALLKLGNYTKKQSLTVNLGGVIPVSISNLVETIAEISETKKKIRYDKSKSAGPMSRIPCIRIARDKLDWTPTTELEDGIKKCWEWMCKEFES